LFTGVTHRSIGICEVREPPLTKRIIIYPTTAPSRILCKMSWKKSPTFLTIGIYSSGFPNTSDPTCPRPTPSPDILWSRHGKEEYIPTSFRATNATKMQPSSVSAVLHPRYLSGPPLHKNLSGIIPNIEHFHGFKKPGLATVSLPEPSKLRIQFYTHHGDFPVTWAEIQSARYSKYRGTMVVLSAS